MALIYEQATSPLYVWITDVAALDAGPYGYPTYRQELEAKLVGLVHSQPRFERTFANREFVPNQVLHEIGKAGPEWVSVDINGMGTSPVATDPDSKAPTRSKTELWEQWVSEYVIPDIHGGEAPDPILLFETDGNGVVQLTDTGRLKRSVEIDEQIRREGKRCLSSENIPNDEYDGLLYMMYQFDDSVRGAGPLDIIPLYIGKAEIYGKKRQLSSNFEEIAYDRNTTGSFARWGDGDYWHVGELSMALHDGDTRKAHWVEMLFENDTRTLSRPTYLWVRAWSSETDIGPYGVPATLAEVEALLIGLAYDAFPDQLLNKDGIPNETMIES